MQSLAEAATVISDLLKSRAAYERLFYSNELRDFFYKHTTVSKLFQTVQN